MRDSNFLKKSASATSPSPGVPAHYPVGKHRGSRLATQIGSNLVGVLYVLDEPSIGLHQRDNQKLIDTLRRLRDLGNTLIVVEHDEDTIRHADHVVDMGPGAGLHGGHVVAEGTPLQIERNKKSLTGQYLARTMRIDVPEKRRESRHHVRITGCSENNLKKIDVEIPDWRIYGRHRGIGQWEIHPHIRYTLQSPDEGTLWFQRKPREI